MNREKFGMLYSLLCKEYKLQTGRRRDFEGYRYARKDMPLPEAGEIRRRIAVLYDLLYRKGGWLNIFAQEEARVVYNGEGVFTVFNNEANCEKYPEKGEVYTLKKITPYAEFAIVELAEFPGMKFEASEFFYLEKRDRSDEELLKEYGTALEKDLQRIDEIIEELDSMPKLTVVEELQQFYEEVKDSNNCDALEEMTCYITPEECVSKFNTGDNFYDGGRNITILCISDKLDKSNRLTYFCRDSSTDSNGVKCYEYSTMLESVE